MKYKILVEKKYINICEICGVITKKPVSEQEAINVGNTHRQLKGAEHIYNLSESNSSLKVKHLNNFQKIKIIN